MQRCRHLCPSGRSLLSPEFAPNRFAACLMSTVVLAFGVLLSGCDDDIGKCCSVLDENLASRIPTSSVSESGNPTSDIAIDPTFDCSSLTCVAFRGTRAFCTEACFGEDDCPRGFTCSTVLEADPGPDSAIRRDDRFCVKERHVCDE